jgi:hypothetical protein
MQLDTYIKLADLFALVKHQQDRDQSYTVYWHKNGPDPKLDDMVLIAEPSSVDETESEDVMPAIVAAKGWWICIYDYILQDVIDLAISQKPSASDAELLTCLRFYENNDTFLDLN